MKKKIIISLTFLTCLIITLIFYPESASGETGTCSALYDFYFLAVGATASGETGYFETTFLLPFADASNAKIIDSRSHLTEPEYKTYLELQEKRKKGNNDAGHTAYCSGYGCLNAGVEEMDYYDLPTGKSYEEAQEYILNDEIVDTSYTDFVYNGDGTVTVKINRDYGDKTMAELGGTGYTTENGQVVYYAPFVITMEVDYPCEEEAPATNKCDATSSGNFGASCGGGGGSGEYTVPLSSSRTRNIPEEDTLNYICREQVTEYITANAIFTQTATMSSGISPATNNGFYAGGGVEFYASYNNKASWSYACGQEEATCSAIAPRASCSTGKLVTCNNRSENCVNGYRCKKEEEIFEYNISKEKCEENDGTPLSDNRCKYVEITYSNFTCDQKKDTYNTCEDQNEANKKIAEAANAIYNSASPSGSLTANRDSNSAEINKTEIGNVGGSASGGSAWYPGTTRTKTMSVSLKNACINAKTAVITYGRACTNEEISGGDYYYIPLLLKDLASFSISLDASNLSALMTDDWSTNFTCSIKVPQKLYNDPDQKNKYLIYRPIDQTGKKETMFPNRAAGENWQKFLRDETAMNSKLNRDEDKIEYSFELTPATIEKIKEYNNSNFYTEFNNISLNGTSSFINDYGITRYSNTLYNELGKCTKECW